MSEQETAKAIDERATAWAIRLDRGDLDVDARAELDLWLAGDSRRRGAFLRAQAAWAMLDRASVMAGDGGSSSAPASQPAFTGQTRRWLIGGGAAIAAAAVGAAYLGLTSQIRYATTLGEIRRVPLADGSVAAINTQSIVKVAFRREERRVRLDQGEAWFQVAKDADRPFVVDAGDVRVRAVGTAFSVHRLETGAEVLVTEGVVEIWSVGAEDRKVRVVAGARAFVSDQAGPVRVAEAPAAIDRTLAWRAGQVVLDGDTLGAAAAEFNRYNSRKIVIDDPALARERFVGRFRTNEPDAFAEAVAATLGMKTTSEGDEIRFGPG